MRTSQDIYTEIKETLGFIPPFFSPAYDAPLVLENLWQQTLSAYLYNPFSALFKEKLNAYLSRYCPVPYCMICHTCSLRPLGVKAKEILELLESPPTQDNDIKLHFEILEAQQELCKNKRFEPGSPLEESLLKCAIFIFLERNEADYYRTQLQKLLGSVNYQHLVAYSLINKAENLTYLAYVLNIIKMIAF